jgi:two-component system, cell cycle response regulator CtrA
MTQHAESDHVVHTGRLSVDLSTRLVSVDGRRVKLTAKEYVILELLSLRKSTTVSREMFLEHLYVEDDEPEMKIIDVFVCKLRKKLASATGGEHYIETVWGRGYVLRDPAATSQENGRGLSPSRRGSSPATRRPRPNRPQ